MKYSFPSICSPPISFGISFSQKPFCCLSRLSGYSNELKNMRSWKKQEHLLSCIHQHENRACTELLQLPTGTGWCQAQGAADCPHAAAEWQK